MGFAGKYEDRLKAQELRKQGLSYGEILKQINVSKDTLSRWCKDINLTEKQKIRLINNKKIGQRKGSIVAAENKRSERLHRTQKIFSESRKELGKLSMRDRFVFGIALYAGEGSKTDDKATFVNANPYYVAFISTWFQEFCNVPLSKMRGSIWLHEGNNEKQAKRYWSNISGIPISQFHKTYVVKNKIDSNKVRKNIHQYGIVSIKFYTSDVQRKIMGWISAFLSDKITTTQAIE